MESGIFIKIIPLSHTTSWNPFYDFCYQTRPYCLLKTIRKGIKFSFLVHLGTCITTPNLYTTFMNSCNQQHFKFWSVLFLFLVFKFKILYHNFKFKWWNACENSFHPFQILSKRDVKVIIYNRSISAVLL